MRVTPTCEMHSCFMKTRARGGHPRTDSARPAAAISARSVFASNLEASAAYGFAAGLRDKVQGGNNILD